MASVQCPHYAAVSCRKLFLTRVRSYRVPGLATNTRKVQCKMCSYENKQYAGGGNKAIEKETFNVLFLSH